MVPLFIQILVVADKDKSYASFLLFVPTGLNLSNDHVSPIPKLTTPSISKHKETSKETMVEKELSVTR